MLVIESGREISARLVQFLNAEWFISVSVFGRMTDVSEVQLLKVPL